MQVMSNCKEAWLPVYQFEVLASGWQANPDSSTSSTYPSIYVINTDRYEDDSAPYWDLMLNNGLPTLLQQGEMNQVWYALFSSNEIKLYAIKAPTFNMILRVKGI